jgi:hypothetical protein
MNNDYNLTRNPKLRTSNLKPVNSIRNQKLETRNPKLKTQNSKKKIFSYFFSSLKHISLFLLVV